MQRPKEPGNFWHRAWVNGVDTFTKRFAPSFHISQDRGEGLIIHGTRQWSDYKVASDIVMHLGRHAGLTVRTQGLRRFYAARITRDGRFEIVRAYDDDTEVLASADFDLTFDEQVPMALTVQGSTISASAGGTDLSIADHSEKALSSGGVGLLVADGAASANVIRVSAVQ